MWKQSYELGVEKLDEQHRNLFAIFDRLYAYIDSLDPGQLARDYADAIEFLKRYVVEHFADEEEYQQSICYPGYELHHAEHESFKQTVAEYERLLMVTNYQYKIVKAFTGKLAAWLVFHVAGSDQRIVGRSGLIDMTLPAVTHIFDEQLITLVDQMFDVMFGIKETRCLPVGDCARHIPGDIFVTIEIFGDRRGEVRFAFDKAMAFGIVNQLLGMEVNEVDDLVCSAIAEMGNIICGNGMSIFADANLTCDISTPVISVDPAVGTLGDEQWSVLLMETPLGVLKMAVLVK